ncbi:tyrosine-protein phosphatase non-receptor type 5-like [Amphiura filiformis]|uniref:tyrosine-protein phosphatase non-receptor type 5-like n=1 Tax=Amphiura filiformis TaxID=82378 RepID=UPI003B2187B4
MPPAYIHQPAIELSAIDDSLPPGGAAGGGTGTNTDPAITEQQLFGNEVITGPTHFWEQSYAPYLIGFGSAIIVIVFAVVCYCSCKIWRAKKLLKEEERMCVYPPIRPETQQGQHIQPNQPYQSYGSHRSEPIKIKHHKNLFERRVSSASLTIEINQTTESVQWVASPPKESSVAEYLESAGNRMTRKQLRHSLKNIRALHEEFWDIPMNHPESIEVPGSASKNRYRTILPNPETRVGLPPVQGDPLSDYINANYIRGYDQEPNCCVATQGPLPHTITDFWRMVWYVNAPIIVMVTKLKERSRPKCEMYWPHKQEVFADIEVTVEEITRKEDYILRIFNLKYLPLDENRQVLHYWYTSWPDNKPPDNPITLLEMIKEVEISRSDPILPKGPVVVHCSAGLGRTGCFIAISIGMRQLEEENMIDILGIICQMRKDRGGMIQTNEQYEFLHQALCMYDKRLPETTPTPD